ncbi:MAG: OsmC family protein [Planctomycetales bacterium]|nr:OsmC family protein [Planctomycetales bacterium]
MDAQQLKAIQAPIKERFRLTPAAAQCTFVSQAEVQAGSLSANLSTQGRRIVAGLHPLAGGDGSQACAADMLVESVAACAGVTLAAVATALGVAYKRARIEVSGSLDFRGTMGVDRSLPVGFSVIDLHFIFDSDAETERLDKLLELTERYCVVLQSLNPNLGVNCRWSLEAT